MGVAFTYENQRAAISANASMMISVLGALAPPAYDPAPPCGAFGPRVPVATSGSCGCTAGGDASVPSGSALRPSIEAAGGTTDGRVDEASAVNPGAGAEPAMDGAKAETRAAIARLGDRLASAIPGSGGGGGPNESQPACEPVPAQVVPTGVAARW